MEDDQVDQYEQDHAAEYQADDDAMEVLRAVADTVRDAKHLVIVGPFDDERVCEVQFTDLEDAALGFRGPIRATVRGESREIEIRPTLRKPPVPFSNVLAEANSHTAPEPPRGRSMGGDAIWHANESEHGTAAFFAGRLSVSATRPSGTNQPPVFENAALSCRHVLAGPQNTGGQGDSVSMVLRPNELTLEHKMDGPHDVAIATVATPDDYHYCQIRALGKIAGVRRPRRHMRIYKYGARTGLTTGRVGRINLPGTGPTSGFLGHPTLWISGSGDLKTFEVPGRFACVHDSGAVVVDDQRRLVGLVFKGSTPACTLDTVTYVMAAAPFSSNKPHETFYVSYKEEVE